MSDKKFYLTTPIYYVNARPHIGHAYTTIVADVLARRHRLLGEDTFFLTGTDEHGQKIARSAAVAGIAPQQFADQVSKSFEDLWHRMGITNDAYIRTTDPGHKRGVQKLFSQLYERGFIYLASYTGQYCVSDEAFVDVAPGEPCPDCGRITETLTEENFFFKLSEFGERIAALIESNELLITPDSRRNEVLSFVKGGLKDLSISRSSFTWGIPVPEPAASAAAQKHVIYVWLDALANYITALGYGSDDETNFNKYWPADLHLVGKEIIRFHCVYWPAFLLAADLPLPKAITAHGWLLFDNSKMSKSKGNIVRTETILDAFGTLCPPNPATPFANTVILSGARSAESKDPEALRSATAAEPFSTENPTKAERDLFASDVLRYFLLREIPFGQDGSFSFEAMITRYNADLANGYGNLVSRTLNLINQNLADGLELPTQPWKFRDVYTGAVAGASGVESGTGALIREIKEFIADVERYSWPTQNFQLLLSQILHRVGLVDGYLSVHKPWNLAKSNEPQNREKLVESLYTAGESIRIFTALLYPFLPYATARIWSRLGLGDIELVARNGELNNLKWGGLKPGTMLGPLAPIFPRADKGLAQIMTDMENPTEPSSTASEVSSQPEAAPSTAAVTKPEGESAKAPEAPPEQASNATPQITIDDFAKIELRVAEIKLAERIPKADKLLRLEVDLGPLGQRQILSGIAEWYAPEELIGRRIVVITNLAPRKMRGLESHGMLLAASNGEGGKPVLATFGEDLALGSRLK